ncbi:MAG: hypothetical protein MUD08_15045 [Cytophagales bacterium]|jgi:hypothetical protein|nr:hypothetical protein [Cytophagales bacterium]
MGVFNFFRKKPEKSNGAGNHKPQMADLQHNPLQVGDIVEALRYELGRCRVVQGDNGPEYESLETGQRVSWLRMIDAATQLQKVKKL